MCDLCGCKPKQEENATLKEEKASTPETETRHGEKKSSCCGR